MKVSIIGGGGLVGSCAAFALQCAGVVSGIDLIDLNADLCKGQALDLLHGASLTADQRIRATGSEAIPESDLVLITAGLRRKPDESRLDLINRNVELFLSILGQVKAAGLKREAILLVVSNPVDVLTYLATNQLGLPARQVIGLGTQLDSARFRSLIAEALKLPPTQVTATILGEHGDSMVPIWSAAQAGGMPLDKFPGWTSATAEALFARTRGSGAEVIKLKGGAGFAVGLAIRDVVHAVTLDQKRILPVSALVNGPYGIRDVCISVPTVVGRKGVEAQLEIELWPKEVSALQHSAQVLRETIDQVLKKNPNAASKAPASAPAPAANSSQGRTVRVTMGSGGNGHGGRSRVTISGMHFPKPQPVAVANGQSSHACACQIPAPVAVSVNRSARNVERESNGVPTFPDGRPDFGRMDAAQRLAYHRKRLGLGS
jgi:L-lactate dehydrogenase